MRIRERAALGLLFVLGIVLVWAGFSGRAPLLFAAVLCPQQVLVVN